MAGPVKTLLVADGEFEFWLYSFAKSGDELAGHHHAFAHKAIIPTGSRFAWFSRNHRGIVEGPHVIAFPAGVWHGMTALSDGAECVAPMPVPRTVPAGAEKASALLALVPLLGAVLGNSAAATTDRRKGE